MAGTKQRTVYFFEPVILDQNDRVRELPDNFWDDVHSHLTGLSEEQRRAEIFGRRFVGAARDNVAPAEKYIYIGRLRPGADWPDVTSSAGTFESLASTGFDGQLIEPAYLLNLRGTNFVGVLRSSAGPSFTAIERWLSQTLGFAGEDDRLELRPYVRHDQLERLNRATKATKVHLKVDPDVASHTAMEGPLGEALEVALSAGAGGVNVELTLSFGNARPDDLAGEELLHGLQRLLGGQRSAPFSKAQATVILENDEGELVKDKIDFARDRITVRQQVGHSEDEEPTPSVILTAMLEASRRFRTQIQ